MGKAILKPREIPVDLPGESVIDREVHIAGNTVAASRACRWATRTV